MKYQLIGNAIYGQSGGPTSVINSSAYGLIKEVKKHKTIIKNFYAMHFGIEGLLKEEIIDLAKYNEAELKKLLTTPGAAFGSNRFKLSDPISDKDKYERILEIFKKYNIRYFFYNGGNDSMDTIRKITNYLKSQNYEINSIGIPKTIDNDLVFNDHTPGYPSAAKFIANAVSEVYFDDASYLNGRVNIVEIMGRNTGWLTACSYLAKLNGAKVDYIYVPETPFNTEDFLNSIKATYSKNKHCLVCVSEGIRDEHGNLIANMSSQIDSFGHKQLGGVAVYLSKLVEETFGYKTRYIELSLLQRANSILSSEVDVKEAIKVGEIACRKALKGESNKMVTIKRISSDPYKVKYDLIDIGLIANKEKYLPLTYLNRHRNNIKSNFFSYAMPLITNKSSKNEENGLFLSFKL